MSIGHSASENNLLNDIVTPLLFQMYSLTILPWLLQAWLTAGSPVDFAAESLLKYSTAENTVLHNDRWGEEVVGLSQKHEQYLPAPPGFWRENRAAFPDKYSQKSPNSENVVPKDDILFGLKDSTFGGRQRESRQHFVVRLIS